MQYASYLFGASALLSTATALGINCRGSGLCPRASWNNKASESVIQVLRDAIYTSTDPTTVSYGNGDHIICVSQSQAVTVGASVSGGGSSGGGTSGGATGTASASGTFSLTGSIGEGGICLFPQNMADGAKLSLAQIRPLTDALLKHGCSTCGSVPIHFVDQNSNDPDNGILTFNYVKNPYCIDSCISGSGQATNNTKRSIGDIPKRLSRPLLQ